MIYMMDLIANRGLLALPCICASYVVQVNEKIGKKKKSGHTKFNKLFYVSNRIDKFLYFQFILLLYQIEAEESEIEEHKSRVWKKDATDVSLGRVKDQDLPMTLSGICRFLID